MSNDSPKEPIKTINSPKVDYIKAARELPTEKWNKNCHNSSPTSTQTQFNLT